MGKRIEALGKEALASVYELPYSILGAPGQAILAMKKIYRDSPEYDPSKEVLSATGTALSAVTEIPVLGKVVGGIGYLGDRGFEKAERLRKEAQEIRGSETSLDRFYSWVGKSRAAKVAGGGAKRILGAVQGLGEDVPGKYSFEPQDAFYARNEGAKSPYPKPDSESAFDNVFGGGAFNKLKGIPKSYRN